MGKARTSTSKPKKAAPGRSIVAPPFVFPKPTPKPLPAVVPSEDPPPGLRCPSCDCAHLPVSYTRRRGKRIMRVRHCRHCGRRVVTYEAAIGTG